MTQQTCNFFNASRRKSFRGASPLFSAGMKLSVTGLPLQTCSLSITTQHAENTCHATDAGVDPATRVVEGFKGGHPTPAFDPSKLTRGECCSNPLP
jgi:hypothetical protein